MTEGLSTLLSQTNSCPSVPASRYALRVVWMIVIAVTIGPRAARSEEASPFAPDAAPVAEAPPPGADPIGSYEFVGFARIVGQVHVCLFDARVQRSRWLMVGTAADGLLVETFDDDRHAVFVRQGTASRWVPLRRAHIQTAPVVFRDDRSIDWQHMMLTDRQKEVKAAQQHWELMEISRQARVDGAPPPAVVQTAGP
jgi:hypothetical protein